MPRRSQHVLGGVWQAVQRAVHTRLSSCRLGLKESIQHCVESSGQFARTRPPALPCGRIERGPAGNVEHASLRKQGDPAYWCAHPKQGRALIVSLRWHIFLWKRRTIRSSPISSWDRARGVPGRIAAADQLQADLTQRTVVTMELSAMVAALKAFGARRIAILTPH